MVFGSYGPTGHHVHTRVAQTACSIGNGPVLDPSMEDQSVTAPAMRIWHATAAHVQVCASHVLVFFSKFNQTDPVQIATR